MNAATVVVDHQDLTSVICRIFREGGSSEEEAQRVADRLIEANLAGHDSHGVGLVPHYLVNLRGGLVKANQHLSVVSDSGALSIVDGNGGYGQVIAHEAMEMAISRTREHGVCVQGLRHSHHIGRVGAWGEMCAEAGFISMHYVNGRGHPPIVAPFRGTESRLSTNPYCCALPATANRPMMVLDMATSKIALGKVRVAANKGEAIAAGTLLDGAGQPTTDPAVMFPEGEVASPRGSLLPVGDHKGYGLALVCELLAGALSGGGAGHPGHEQTTNIVNNMLSVVIDPARLNDVQEFADEVDAMLDYVTANRPADPDLPVLVPGDPERILRRQRLADGIPIDATTWGQIVEAAQSSGFTPQIATSTQ